MTMIKMTMQRSDQQSNNKRMHKERMKISRQRDIFQVDNTRRTMIRTNRERIITIRRRSK